MSAYTCIYIFSSTVYSRHQYTRVSQTGLTSPNQCCTLLPLKMDFFLHLWTDIDPQHCVSIFCFAEWCPLIQHLKPNTKALAAAHSQHHYFSIIKVLQPCFSPTAKWFGMPPGLSVAGYKKKDYTGLPKTNMAGWKIPMFNRIYICEWWIFHCHVSFFGLFLGNTALTFILSTRTGDQKFLPTCRQGDLSWICYRQQIHEPTQ